MVSGLRSIVKTPGHASGLPGKQRHGQMGADRSHTDFHRNIHGYRLEMIQILYEIIEAVNIFIHICSPGEERAV